jgi:hypothetical protein
VPYSNNWDENAPLGSTAANTIHTIIQNMKKDVRERVDSIFGTSGANSFGSAIDYVPRTVSLKNPTATLDSYLTVARIDAGNDATHGPLGLNIQVRPSATPSSRAIRLQALDNGALRPMILNAGSVSLDTNSIGIGTGTAQTLITLANNQQECFIRSAAYGGAIRMRGDSGSATDRALEFGRVDNAGVWAKQVHLDTNSGAFVINNEQAGSETFRVNGTSRFSSSVASTAPNAPAGANQLAYFFANQAGAAFGVFTFGSIANTTAAGVGFQTTTATSGNLLLFACLGGSLYQGAAISPAGVDEMAMFLYDGSAATLKRIHRGAPDSAGAGFRTLRIAN